jgi:chromosome segregation ATPase
MAEAGGNKEGGQGGGPDGLTELQKRLDALAAQIAQAQQAIDSGNVDVKNRQAAVQGQQDQLKALQVQQRSLQQVVDGFKRDQQTVAQQRQAATADATAAQGALDQIQAALDEELAPEYRGELDAAVKQADDRIAQLTQDRDSKQAAAQAAADKSTGAKGQVTQAQAALTQAQADVRGLPQRIQAASGQVKKLQAQLEAAYKRGPAKETYLLTGELAAALAALTQLTDPATEKQLGAAMQKAWSDLDDATAAAAKADGDRDAAKKALDDALAALKDATENRRKAIEAALPAAPAGGGQQPAANRPAAPAPSSPARAGAAA